MRLIFMGTPEFAVPSLQRLIEDRHELGAVFTQPDKPAGRGKIVHQPPVKVTAAAHKLTCYQPAKIKTNEDVRRIFEDIAPDACVVAAYGKILPPWLLEIPRLGCINVHASLLPKYRGAAPINWAIANRETVTGISIMQMDPGMDTGPVWSKRSTEIGADEAAPELSLRLSMIGADLVSETLPAIASGNLKSIPQNNEEATYAPILKREDGAIDWSSRAGKIAAQVLAFQPWPGSYTIFRGCRLTLWRAREQSVAASPEQSSMPLSTIVAIDKGGFDVVCGERSLLRIEELQVEGKKRVGAGDFLNGARLTIGSRILV
jgi:methionyl-tRNA formyltransferase